MLCCQVSERKFVLNRDGAAWKVVYIFRKKCKYLSKLGRKVERKPFHCSTQRVGTVRQVNDNACFRVCVRQENTAY